MNKIILAFIACLSLVACNNVPDNATDPAASRQAAATSSSMDAADREVGMPRMMNYAQRKLLKNAYEDMDQTTLTYVYSQALDGKFVCLGQALGYGVSLGTQFTAPEYPRHVPGMSAGQYVDENWLIAQPDPNGLYQPSSGAATIVDLINPDNGEAHTAIIEPNVVTVPFKLPASVVEAPCPAAVDPKDVKDVKETSSAEQLK